ncbi:13261_t:CDS:2 [Ambispora leptoticha]|uniref:13261_t:CDS:1 n=1 Tax=Ambispora leptoticha TaxID=144679 RepID=A0A9N9DD63_9GLOM|nr:13261_t:CDS:2 [Ambispora leptoticha]
MTLYLSLVFALLVVELPFPSSWRRTAFRWISQSTIIAQLQYAFKILFIFVFILFADSLNRIWKVEQESAHASEHIHDVSDWIYLISFLNSQPNVCPDLGSIDSRREVGRDEEKTVDNESQLKKEIEILSSELEEEKKKSLDFNVLKKQASQQSDEYMRLAERYNELEKKVENRIEENKKDS